MRSVHMTLALLITGACIPDGFAAQEGNSPSIEVRMIESVPGKIIARARIENIQDNDLCLDTLRYRDGGAWPDRSGNASPARRWLFKRQSDGQFLDWERVETIDVRLSELARYDRRELVLQSGEAVEIEAHYTWSDTEPSVQSSDEPGGPVSRHAYHKGQSLYLEVEAIVRPCSPSEPDESTFIYGRSRPFLFPG